MDLTGAIPGGTAVRGLRLTMPVIQAKLPEIKIGMLTTSPEDADLFEALKSGASALLLKNLQADELFDYLDGLTRGRRAAFPPAFGPVLRECNRQAAELEACRRPGLRGAPAERKVALHDQGWEREALEDATEKLRAGQEEVYRPAAALRPVRGGTGARGWVAPATRGWPGGHL